MCNRNGASANNNGDFNPIAAEQAFKQHRHDLLVAIGNALQLVHHLTTRELIPESTKKALVPGLSHSERNSALLDAIEAHIKTNPGFFHTFVKLLQGDVMLQAFGARLLESYRKY